MTYKGHAARLFKEEQRARWCKQSSRGGVFRATEVLAKHDENYMPPRPPTPMEQAQKAAQTLSQ